MSSPGVDLVNAAAPANPVVPAKPVAPASSAAPAIPVAPAVSFPAHSAPEESSAAGPARPASK
jgi:hypothetical protein